MVKFEIYVDLELKKKTVEQITKFDKEHDDIYTFVGLTGVKFETFNRDKLELIQKYSLHELGVGAKVHY